MPEAIREPAPPPSAPPAAITYGAGGGRKSLLSFALLLLLPFVVSLPVMLFNRLRHGLIEDAVGLFLFGILLATLVWLVTVHLAHALRSEVVIGPDRVAVHLPRHVGAIPTLRYAISETPYKEIATVETRREIYGNSLTPVMVRGARIITRDGRMISLGYMNESETDPTFPVASMAAEIARRAGIAVTDRGNVRRMLAKKVLGIKAGSGDDLVMSASDIVDLERRHKRAMIGVVALLGLLLIGGIVRDLSTGDIDRGERAATRTQEVAQPTTRAAAQKKQ